jgi:hypothetical protein
MVSLSTYSVLLGFPELRLFNAGSEASAAYCLVGELRLVLLGK